MAQHSKPKRGSHAFSPRKRARAIVPTIRSWPSSDGNKPYLQGFAGYKAGMTHVLIVDYRPTSTTSGQQVFVPVTVLETPPMKIFAVRLYKNTPYGMKALTEIWAEGDAIKELKGVVPIPKKKKEKEIKEYDDVRILAMTEPWRITGIPQKKPHIMEIRVGGGDLEARFNYANELLGKEIGVKDVFKEGDMMDAIAVTKGKGFQGAVKRWGVKLLHHKNRKHRRMIGTLGPWLSWVRSTVPQAGQMGFHKRTDYNKRILKIGENGEEITPNGGFPHYGVVKNEYVIVHGSLPGSVKRIIRMRHAVRYIKGIKVEKPEITYISTTSKQGV